MMKLPNQLNDLFQQQQLSTVDVIHWMLCNRNIAGESYNTWLALKNNQLLILSDASVEAIALEQIESLSIVNHITSGMIALKMEEERAVASFTNAHRERAGKFAAVFAKLKKGEPIEAADVEEEHKNTSCPKCGLIYPDPNRPVCPKCMKKFSVLFRLLAFAGNYKPILGAIILFMLLNAGTGLVIPYFQGEVLFDQALGNKGTFAGQIGLVVLLIVVFRSASLLFGVLFGVLNAKLSANVVFDLKTMVFSALQRLSLQFFHKKQTGQLMTRVNSDANELQAFFVDGIAYFIVNAMNIVGIILIMFWIDWRLTLLSLIPLPFVMFLIRWVYPRLMRYSIKRHRTRSRVNSIVSDTMQGVRVIKAFGNERRESARFQRANTAFSVAEQTYAKSSNTVFPIVSLVTQFGAILIWAFGGWRVMEGDFTFGKIMTFMSYLFMLYGPLEFMNNIVGWWSYCMTAAQRIFEIQDSSPDVVEKPNAVVLRNMRGDIAVTNVTFGYEPNKPVIKEVTFQAKAGQMIGVVGHSGAGKSTLVNLISRLYDVNQGEILIDQVNIKDMAMRSLRENIGIVSQDVYVFSGTIAENIAYAKPNCSIEEIIRAAKIAHAHSFIERLPDGYDTLVGTGAHLLSGGEKQRISIARAVLHNPKILILDEATASLDTETELQIQEALEALMVGRTTIAIAHRLSTLRNADYLLVMEHGKVVESGTHTELIAQEGAYFRLVNKHNEALQMAGVG